MAKKVWHLLFKQSPMQVLLITVALAIILQVVLLFIRPACPEIKELLTEKKYPFVTRAAASTDTHFFSEPVSHFYERNNYALVWITPDGKLKPYSRIMIHKIESAYEDGLNPFDYHVTEIKALKLLVDGAQENTVDKSCAALDLILTDAFFSYTSHHYAGRIHEGQWNTEWRERIKEISPADSLKKIEKGGTN